MLDFLRLVAGFSQQSAECKKPVPILLPVIDEFPHLEFTAIRTVTSVPEAMAYVAQSQSYAAGRGGATRVVMSQTTITDRVDMQALFSFTDEHSAEWNRPIQKTYKCFRELLDQFHIDQ